MWKPLFPYYFLLIAVMTKTKFINSQQLLSLILSMCEVITIHKINMNSFIFLYSFYFSHDHSKIAKLFDSTLIFIIDNSRTRLHSDHKAKLKTNSYQDFNLLDQDITKRIELSKTIKIGVWRWYDTGAPPPSLAVAKGSAHTHVIMSSEVVKELLMM